MAPGPAVLVAPAAVVLVRVAALAPAVPVLVAGAR